MIKPGVVRTFMAAPIPEGVGEEGSGTGSRMGPRNWYICS